MLDGMDAPLILARKNICFGKKRQERATQLGVLTAGTEVLVGTHDAVLSPGEVHGWLELIYYFVAQSIEFIIPRETFYHRLFALLTVRIGDVVVHLLAASCLDGLGHAELHGASVDVEVVNLYRVWLSVISKMI